jgi:hypothetical protein
MTRNYLTGILLFMTVLTAQAQIPSDSLAVARTEILALIDAMENYLRSRGCGDRLKLYFV